MPSYLALLRWTQKGVQNIKESPARLEKAKSLLSSVGGEFKGFYMTMGAYDMVLRFETPDEATAAKFLLAMESQGSVQSETLRAFTEEEYRKIIASLP